MPVQSGSALGHRDVLIRTARAKSKKVKQEKNWIHEVIGASHPTPFHLLRYPSISSNQPLPKCSTLHETEPASMCVSVCSCIRVFMSWTQHPISSGNWCQFKSMPGHKGAGATVQSETGARGDANTHSSFFRSWPLHTHTHTNTDSDAWNKKWCPGRKFTKIKASLRSGEKIFYILHCNDGNHTLCMHLFLCVCMRPNWVFGSISSHNCNIKWECKDLDLSLNRHA